jgi:hypothetical protein
MFETKSDAAATERPSARVSSGKKTNQLAATTAAIITR